MIDELKKFALEHVEVGMLQISFMPDTIEAHKKLFDELTLDAMALGLEIKDGKLQPGYTTRAVWYNLDKKVHLYVCIHKRVGL